MAKEITPNGEFYITTCSDNIPVIVPNDFRLRIEGLVDKPLTFTLEELEGLKDKTEFVTLESIGNPVYHSTPVAKGGESCIGIFMKGEWNSDGCSYSSSLS
ncbi:MAG: molybdopterin-dependent oxidoreductase [Chloroflexota bacterium]